MTNWCQNVITIEADDDNIALVKELIYDGNREVDFTRAVDMPDSIKNATAEFNTSMVVEPTAAWANANWGTSSNAFHTMILPNNDIYFTTKWQPPLAWFAGLCKLLDWRNININIKMVYGEAGQHIGGYVTNDDHGGVIRGELSAEELNEFLASDEEDPEDEDANHYLIPRLNNIIDGIDFTKILNVPIKQICDALTLKYEGSVTFATRANDTITMMVLDEPDGIRISCYESDLVIQLNELDKTLYDDISKTEKLSSIAIIELAQALAFIDKLLNNS